ncbi:MAG: thrombospondin type 3 repeat-containing protein [bacterium]|nr:thrombospondin type 3 repeat-containing protein [bacterium]
MRSNSKIIIAVLSLFLAAPAFAQDTGVNAGFVSGIWYSQYPFFAGDTVRIYTALQNQSGFDIIGRIQFFDVDKVLGESEFEVINGRLIEKWTDWQATAGEHEIYVKLIDTFKTLAGSDPEPINLGSSTSGVDKRFVDSDNDDDNVGDLEDTDDDNDGLDDEQEKNLGTDPLNPDTDSDGVSDGEEIKRNSNPTSGTGIGAGSVARKVADDLGEKTSGVIEKVTEKLEERIENIQAEIDEIEEMQIQGGELAGAKAEKDNDLTGKKFYKGFLSALVFILDKKWLLLIVIILLLKYLWKFYRMFRD